jgi:ADP-ribose pyrophosphatase
MAGTVVYQGRKLSLVLETVTPPAGPPRQVEIVQHRGAVVILPFLDGDRVCLVRQWRPAVRQTLLELPAGTLEPGEAPEATARRELAEETGYTADHWRHVRTFFPSPGVMTEQMHLFVAEGLAPGAARPEPEEQLEPVILPWAEAVRLALEGGVHDGKTLVGLLLWDRLRAPVRPA